MTKDYLFFLGRDEALSFAEIVSYLRARKTNHDIKTFKNKLALIAIDGFDASKAIRNLGGTVKIAEEIKSLDNVYQGSKNSIKYSVWDNDDLGLEEQLKRYFKDENVKAMLRKTDNMNPTRDSNIDLEVISYKKLMFKTIAVSNPKEYKSRDEKRPEYDAKTVISMRLARILINLSQVSENKTLLDPFAGLGTVLQEGLLMGLNVIGFEKDRETISRCKKNIEWLGKKFTGKWKLINSDSRKIGNYMDAADGVATEPYLGPYYKTLPSMREAVIVIKELEELYLGVLKELKKVVKGKTAIIVPRFKTKEGKRVELNFERILGLSGLKTVKSIPEITFPLPYYHSTSNIERFIYVLE